MDRRFRHRVPQQSAAAAVPATAFVKAGSFRSRTTTGVDAVTLGFQPKGVVLVLAAPNFNGATLSAGIQVAVAVSDGTTTRCASLYDGDNVGTTVTRRAWEDTLCALNNGAPPTKIADGAVSFTATGFEINWATISAAWSVGYWAVGGPDVSGKVTAFSKGTGTGSVSYNGIGFQPKGLVGISAAAGADPEVVAGAAGLIMGLGDDDVTDERGLGTNSNNAQSAGDSSKCYNHTFFQQRNIANSANNFLAGLNAVGADGFDLIWTTAPSSTTYFAVLCIGGSGILNAEVVDFVADTTSGAHTQTMTMPFQASGGVLLGNSTTAVSSTGSVGARASVGMFDDAGNQVGMTFSTEDAADPTITASGVANTGAVMAYDSSDDVAEVVGALVNPTGSTIDANWLTKNTTAYQWSVLIVDV